MECRANGFFVALLSGHWSGPDGVDANRVVNDRLHGTGGDLLAVDGTELDSRLAVARAFCPVTDEPTGLAGVRAARFVHWRLQLRVAQFVGDHFEIACLGATDISRLEP